MGLTEVGGEVNTLKNHEQSPLSRALTLRVKLIVEQKGKVPRRRRQVSRKKSK